MEAPNTQGLLKFSESAHEANQFSIHNETGNWLLSVRHNGEQMPATQRANLARLVACWNACDGISTENLEDNEPVKMLAEKYNDLIAERDALLAFAQSLIDAWESPEGIPNPCIIANAARAAKAQATRVTS